MVVLEAFCGKSGLVDGRSGRDWLLGRIEMVEGAWRLIVSMCLCIGSCDLHRALPTLVCRNTSRGFAERQQRTVDHKAVYILPDLSTLYFKV